MFHSQDENQSEACKHLFDEECSDGGRVTVQCNRDVDPDVKAKDVLKQVPKEDGNIDSENALVAVEDDEILLFLDGLHKGDKALRMPHHYLSTSGGHKTPVGESARVSTLVALGGWQKTAQRQSTRTEFKYSDEHKKHGAATAGDAHDMLEVEETDDGAATADSNDMRGLEEKAGGAANTAIFWWRGWC